MLNIKLRKIFAIIGLCVMITGCSVGEKDEIRNKIFNLLQSYKLEHEKATLVYFFIPLDGCGECIKKSICF